MAEARTKIGLRPYLAADAPMLAAIFSASIEELTEDDYSDAQREAWASVADDEDEFAKRLASQLTLIAMLNGAPVGFASLKGADQLDMLFVHPTAARQGVASALCDALEKLALARGACAITVEASDTAQPLFAKRGYVAAQRNSVTIGDEWLANTTMTKQLATARAPGGTPGRPS